LLLKLTGVDLSRCPCCHQGTMIPPAIWRLRSGNLVGTLHEQAILLRALTDFGRRSPWRRGVPASRKYPVVNPRPDMPSPFAQLQRSGPL
jgi:hypothetical protein